MSDQEVVASSAAEASASGNAFIEVVVRNRRAQPFFGRHPWVFVGAVDRVNGMKTEDVPPGSIAKLVNSDGRFIAWGLFNPISRIVARLYSWQLDQPLDAAFWEAKIHQAVESRRAMFDLNSPGTGCRLIFSEADGLSGLTVDFYGGYLLVQFTSLALFLHRDAILNALQAEVNPKGIWLRTEKGMREA